MGGAGQAMGGASQAAWPGRVRSAVENPILGKSSQTFQRRRHAVFGWQVNSQLEPGVLQSTGLQRVGHDESELKNVAEKRHRVCVCACTCDCVTV